MLRDFGMMFDSRLAYGEHARVGHVGIVDIAEDTPSRRLVVNAATNAEHVFEDGVEVRDMLLG